MILNHDQFTLKIAQSEAELSAAQRLRYRVFVEEMGARPAHEPNGAGHEADAFDPFCDHLILKDESIADDRDNVVGVYRLMQGEIAAAGPGFYGASEYDLRKITNSGRRVLELGRSCVDARYRGSLALHLLWQGVEEKIAKKRNRTAIWGRVFCGNFAPRVCRWIGVFTSQSPCARGIAGDGPAGQCCFYGVENTGGN